MNQIIKTIAVLFAVLAGWGPALAQPHFTEVAERTGVSNRESNALPACVSWADFDNDGWQDVYVTYWGEFVTGRITPEGFPLADTVLAEPCRLYRNNRDGTFTDVATRAGVAEYNNGGMWGDYDDDGDLDFFAVSQPNYPTPSRLYRNNGDGIFTDVAVQAKVDDQPEGQSINVGWTGRAGRGAGQRDLSV